MIYVIYPEEKIVTPEQIIAWAKDAYANDEVDHEPEDLQDAIYLLADCGHITVKTHLH